ncbi:MAG: SGNH/GDSL hydrolase family protein [Christensenellales bacterium]|jgi:acyl-CoA thioesterase-1
MKLIRDIIIWGDSLIKGIAFDSIGNRYSTIRENGVHMVENSLGVTIKNRARFGCTAPKGKMILQKDLQTGMSADVGLIEFGGNDCDFDWKQVSERPLDTHQPKTPLGAFKEAMIQMIHAVRKTGATPMVMSMPPLDAERYFEFISRGGLNKKNIIQWLGDVQHIYRWHELYSNEIVKLALENDCILVDVRGAFLQEWDHRQYLCEDGIHLNEKGQKFLGNIFVEYARTRKPALV